MKNENITKVKPKSAFVRLQNNKKVENELNEKILKNFKLKEEKASVKNEVKHK